MVRRAALVTRLMDFEELLAAEASGFRRGLTLAPKPRAVARPDKYGELELRRRRAQIRARRSLGVV